MIVAILYRNFYISAGTTVSINYLKKRGYIKPVPSREELKGMYKDKRNDLKERKDEMLGRFELKSEEIRLKFEDRKVEMRALFEERKSEIRQRFPNTKNIMNKIEESKGEFVDKFDENVEKLNKISGTSEIKNSIEQHADKINAKLKEAKEDIIQNIAEKNGVVNKYSKK